jgi:plasmid stabilization system protein ParE
MAAQIVWSPESADDLEQIVRHIARDSERYAANVAAKIVATVEHAAEFPRAGRMVPEFDDDDQWRERIVYSYRVIYRIYGDAVHVVAIIHGARDFFRALGDRDLNG